MRGSRPRALPPEATPTLRSLGRGEVRESQHSVATSVGGEVRESEHSVAPSVGGEVRQSQHSIAPCEGGEVRRSKCSRAPCEGGEVRESQHSKVPSGGESQLQTNSLIGRAADRKSNLDDVQRERMSPELIKSILDTACQLTASVEARRRGQAK